jgi:N-acylglucosamine 2-epimerase
MGEGDYRCVFLMNRDGSPKKVEGYEALDMSIYADCFVVIGLSRYALTSGDQKAYAFAKKLHASCVSRIESGDFNTLPYPVSKKFRAHGIPMIMSNTTKELCLAADAMDGDYGAHLRALVRGYTEDILTNFVDESNVLHEFILSETNEFFPEILCQHMNPGHTIEDMWFAYEAAALCGESKWNEKIPAIAKKAIENGWDEEFGGILHFSGVAGGEPVGDATGVENEPMTKLLSDWGSKLWWVHSEALYTSLLCYFNTGDKDFLAWFEKIFDYTFKTFPGKNPEVREWLQIRTRDGAPQDKVVALPVKDPFHITRNLVLILELLSEKMN